jgi:hypothetical protein
VVACVSDDYADAPTVIMTRQDGRMMTTPVRGRCPACLAEMLFLLSTEEAP